MTTRYIHFPLHPDTPDEGISIQKLFANRDAADLKAAGDHIRGLMREAGLAYGDRTMTYNSRLAQELGAWADAETDHGDALHNKLFEAYFVRNDNIGDASVLL
ncbi:MAG: DsbA family oxidoreductase, partial [Proteobacteria bacterium]|nr:DsbA family oxidoreductase [Pseudomonadota bacterium]